MKTFLLSFLAVLILLSVQPVQAGDFLEEIFGNKPQAYFGFVYSYSPVANSLGISYLKAPLDSQTVTTTYISQAIFSDKAFWQSKDLAQLGHYAIIYGTHNTLFGRDGIQPFWGYTAYNLKYLGFNLGLGLYDVDDLIAKHINLTYDFFLEQTSLDFVFMF